MGSSDIGAPFRDTGLSLSPSQMHGLIDQVLLERRSVTVNDVSRAVANGDSATFELTCVPLDDERLVGLLFQDVTRYRELRTDLEHSQRELESAYEELQSAVEELETTNEELQSTNEELETTNEELHSTNEELETMNEELQSTNEELESINNEARVRSTEVDELNDFLQSILGSLRSAVVVLGPEMEVRAWNRQAEDYWGLRSDEVEGLHFLNLDIGFPVEVLGAAIRRCLAGRSEGEHIVQQAVNRRGRTIECAVTISNLISAESNRGVILIMDSVPA